MILGIGIDLVDIRRIQKILDRYPDTFVRRFFSEKERTHGCTHPKKAAHYAKRFAAKEAFIKAIGGLKGVSLKDIWVANQSTGQPHIVLSEKAGQILWPQGCRPDIFVSLTDEFPYAQAIVILLKKTLYPIESECFPS